MRARYIPGKGIVRIEAPGKSRRVQLQRNTSRGGRLPSLAFMPVSGEIAVRVSNKRVFRRKLYQR